MPADTLFFPGGVLALSSQAADRILSSGSGDAALLYLQLLRLDGADRERARRALSWTEDRVYTAWKELEKLGLVDPAAAPVPVKPDPDQPPEYTAADLAKELEDVQSPFPFLVREVQQSLGKVLSTADLKALYTIYDYLALPAEVIFLLVHHCIAETEEKYGAGRRPRMSQIKREAYRWVQAGADTAEAADAYLKRLETQRRREEQLLPLLGIFGRSPVESERKYLLAWTDWGFPDEAISMAYERTVLRKGALNWAYMNSILKNWHAAGLHTVEQIETGDNKGAPWKQQTAPKAPAPAGAGTGALGEADRRARDDMERMRRFLEQEKKKAGDA